MFQVSPISEKISVHLRTIVGKKNILTFRFNYENARLGNYATYLYLLIKEPVVLWMTFIYSFKRYLLDSDRFEWIWSWRMVRPVTGSDRHERQADVVCSLTGTARRGFLIRWKYDRARSTLNKSVPVLQSKGLQIRIYGRRETVRYLKCDIELLGFRSHKSLLVSYCCRMRLCTRVKHESLKSLHFWELTLI